MFYFFSTLTSADAVQFLKIIIFFIERLLLPPVITRDFREKVDANQRYSAIILRLCWFKWITSEINKFCVI